MEIERLTGSLEAKDNLITEMEDQQEQLIAEQVRYIYMYLKVNL